MSESIEWARIRAGCPRCAARLQWHSLTVWCLRCGWAKNWHGHPPVVDRFAGMTPAELLADPAWLVEHSDVKPTRRGEPG